MKQTWDNYFKEYYIKNKEKKVAYAIRWRNENREKYNSSQRKWSQTPAGIYKSIKNRCRLKGYDIADKNQFIDWFKNVKKVCCYCGISKNVIKPVNIKGTIVNRLTIERIDNSNGYVLNNIALACCICNMTRGNIFTHLEMLSIGKIIREVWKRI